MRIDFYVLDSENEKDKLLFCCKLIEKILFKIKNEALPKILIICQNQSMLEQLDTLLWQFKKESFIAHLPYEEFCELNVEIPVILTKQKIIPQINSDIIVKLDDQPWQKININDQSDQNLRLLEIVDQDKNVLESSRKKFRFYKASGLSIHTHKIKN